MQNKLTKKEIIKRLKKFGVEATLRPRKATLLELLKEKVNASTKDHCSGWYPVDKIEQDTNWSCIIRWISSVIVVGLLAGLLIPW